MSVLYLSPVLPKRSETFVYREVLGLRALGIDVRAASLYPPEKNLGDPLLDRLAEEVVPVYGTGVAALLRDAACFEMRHPIRAGTVYATAYRDALLAGDVRTGARPKILYQAVAALALAWRVRRMGVARVHAQMAHSAATVAMYAAKALRVPFSFTGHAADLFRERCLLAEKLRRADFVCCISEWHRGWYRGIVQRPDECYPVIRCGVYVPPPSARHPRPPSAPLRVLGLGRLVPKKGFDTLVEAVRILVQDGVSVECTVAGDGPELAKLQNLAAGLPVRFPGAVVHSGVPALLEASDVFALPCRVAEDGDRDGIPVVLMEAMAREVCAVSGDLPTIRELIADGVNGCMVPPGDPQALADCLRRLGREPETRERLAKAGRARVEGEFSSQINLARLSEKLQGFRGCRDRAAPMENRE